MAREALIAMLVVAMLGTLGCTSVQKGSAAGGAAGAAAGAGVGHYLTSLGGVPGGLIGLGLGAAGGAIAAESMYEPQDLAVTAELDDTVAALSSELAAKNAELQNMQLALEKEKAQQKALLQAYEKAQTGSVPLQTQAPAGVQISANGNEVTFTILSEVMFQSGKANLTAAGKKALQESARMIRKQYPNAVIEVRGHTDNVPIRYSPYKSNWELSCSRALSVVHYLIETQGFSARKLAAVGCGDSQPVASNSTAEGRRKNRRAELVVMLSRPQMADIKTSR